MRDFDTVSSWAEEQGLAARFLQRDGDGYHETLSSHMLAMLDE